MAVLEYLTNNSLTAYPFKYLNGDPTLGDLSIKQDWFYDIIFISFSPTIRSVYVSRIAKSEEYFEIVFNNSETLDPIAELSFPATDLVVHLNNKTNSFISGTDNLTYAVKLIIGPGLVAAPIFDKIYTKEEAELCNSAVVLSSPRVNRIDFKKYVGSESSYSLEAIASIPQNASKLQLLHNITYQQQNSNYGLLSVIAGAGAGLYDDCAARDPNIYTINAIEPTTTGAIFLNFSTCYSSELLTNKLKDNLTYDQFGNTLDILDDYYLFKAYTGNSAQTTIDVVAPNHSIVIQNFCTPKCSPETMSAFAHYLNRVNDGAADLDKLVTRKTETRGKGSRASSVIFNVAAGDFCLDESTNPFTRCLNTENPSDYSAIICGTEFIKNYHEGRDLEISYSPTSIQSHKIVEVIDSNSVRVSSSTPFGVFNSPKLFFRVVDNGVISNMNCAASAYNTLANSLVSPYFQVRYTTNESFNASNEYGTLLSVVVALFNPSPEPVSINVSFNPTKLAKQGDIKIRKAGDVSSVVVPTTTLACREYAFVEVVYFIKCANSGGALHIDVNDVTGGGIGSLIGSHDISPVNGAECIDTISGTSNSYLVTQTEGISGEQFEKLEPWLEGTETVSDLLGVTPPSWLVYTRDYTDPESANKAVRFTVNATLLQQAVTSALYTMYYRVTTLNGAKAISQVIIEYVAKPVIISPSNESYSPTSPLIVSLEDEYTASNPLLTVIATNMVKLSTLTDSLNFFYSATTEEDTDISTYGLAIDAISGKITGKFLDTLQQGATLGIKIFANNPAGQSQPHTINVQILSTPLPVLIITSGQDYHISNIDLFTEENPLYTFTVQNAPILYYDLIEIYTQTRQIPPGFSFNYSTGRLSGKIPASYPEGSGEINVRLKATNNNGDGYSEAIRIWWDTLYSVPSITTYDYLGNETDSVGVAIGYNNVVFTASASYDPITEPLVYSAENIPPGFTINSSTGTISGTLDIAEYPANYETNNYNFYYTFKIIATNRVGSAFKTLKLSFSTAGDLYIENNPGTLTVVKGRGYTSSSPLYRFNIGGVGTVSQLTSTGLPSGLSTNTVSRTIEGFVATSALASYSLVSTRINLNPSTAISYYVTVPYNFTLPTTARSYDRVINQPILDTDIVNRIPVSTCGRSSGGSVSSFTVVSGGALPPGMSVTNLTTGIGAAKSEYVIGTPTKLGSYSFKLQSIASSINTAISPTITINIVDVTYTISGTVLSDTDQPITGVTVAVGYITTTTAADGTYTISNLSPGDYDISATLDGTFFDVPVRAVKIVSSNISGINFKSLGVRRSISGKVTAGADPVASITIGDGTRTVNTNSLGEYTIYSATSDVTIAPVSATYIFNPTSYTIAAGTTSITGKDFAGTLIGVLPAPTNLTATPGNASIALAFSVLTSNHQYTANYQYSWNNTATSTSSGWQNLSTTTTPSGANTNVTATISGLTNGSGYSIQVRAVSTANGNGYASLSVYAVPATAATAPTVYYRPGDARFTLTIVAPVSTGGGAIYGYQYTSNNADWLYVADSGIIATQTSTGNPPFVNGTTYTISVRAVTITGTTYIIGQSTSGATVTPTTPASAPTL